MDNSKSIELSLIIPVFNESGNLKRLFSRLKAVLVNLNMNYEIIFINDGSTDDSLNILKEIQQNEHGVVIIDFRRNFGQTAAFSAGFDHAEGNLIITMDSDLENFPEDIPKLLDRLRDGYDIVSGWRNKRKDNLWIRILPSLIANRIISYICGIRLHDFGCSLKVYKRDIIKNIRLYGDMHRFIPALASFVGINVAEVPVDHLVREHGKSNYGILRFVKVILDLIVLKFLLNYTSRPFHIFGLLGLSTFLAGLLIAAYLSVLKLIYHVPLAERPLLLLSVLCIIFGIQLITIGLLCEIMIRNYYESQDKPIYIIREISR